MKFLYRPVHTASVGPFLMKTIRHKSKDCEVCENQLLKDSAIRLDTGKSQTKNKILQKYRFPEVIHEGLSCSACKTNPIKGNRYFCLVCSDLNFCETCGDFEIHDHPLLFTSSEQKQTKLSLFMKIQ